MTKNGNNNQRCEITMVAGWPCRLRLMTAMLFGSIGEEPLSAASYTLLGMEPSSTLVLLLWLQVALTAFPTLGLEFFLAVAAKFFLGALWFVLNSLCAPSVCLCASLFFCVSGCCPVVVGVSVGPLVPLFVFFHMFFFFFFRPLGLTPVHGGVFVCLSVHVRVRACACVRLSGQVCQGV